MMSLFGFRVICPWHKDSHKHSIHYSDYEGGFSMYGGGTFGCYTCWAVVFLIIFVLFFLLVPGAGAAGY